MAVKPVLRRAAIVVAALLVAVLVVGGITTVTFIRRPLPNHSGQVTLTGLNADVTVIRDERGVPQIYADDPVDLFMAQGYVNAQDRFFQMDYRRHLTAGRMAELVGDVPTAISADKAIRTMGWRRVAEAEWDLLNPQTRAYLTAYADGVNAYLADRSPSQVALEYTVLGMNVTVEDIEPWDPIDSLAWLKAMAWDLRGSYGQELQRAAVYGRTGSIDMVSALFPEYPIEQNLPILPTAGEIERHREAEQEQAHRQGGGTVAGQASDTATAADAGESVGGPHDAGTRTAGALPGEPAGSTRAHAQQVPFGTSSPWAQRARAAGAPSLSAIESALAALHAVPQPLGSGQGIGSNSWVVSGEHTASGQPILANDPHLAPSAPSIWYQQGLHCRDVGPECPFNVSGFGFAGMPGIIIGHNGQLAWGLTNLSADASDFFLERVYDDGTYLYDGRRLPVQTRTEVIQVAGADPIELTVRSTRHGPLISGAIGPAGAAAQGPVPENAPDAGPGGYEVALAWTALEPGRTMDAVFMMDLAKNPQDIAEVAALFEVPTQNIVYATTDGDIGYQAPGKIPIRNDVPGGPVPSDGTWPRPGWNPAYDWQGFIDTEDLPAAVNPPSGLIVTANQPVQNLTSHPELGTDFDYGYRAQEIRDQLRARITGGHALTVADMNRIQMVEVNPAAQMLVPALQGVADRTVDRQFLRSAVDLLDDWDYVNRKDSAAAAYFSSVWANLLRLTFWDQVPPDQRPEGDSRAIAVIAELLTEENSPWWDDKTTVNVVEQRDEIIHRALVDARAQLTVQLGKDPNQWQWGRLHVLTPEHPVLGGDGVPGVVADYFNLPGVQLGGGPAIVNATGWNAAAWDGGYPDFSVDAVPSMRMVVDLADLDSSTWVNLTGNSGHPASDHYADQYDAWAEGRTYPWPFSREAVEAAAEETMTLVP